MCQNGCEYHLRCEGIIQLDENEIEPISFTCKKCKNFGTNKNRLKGTMAEAHQIFTDKIQKVNKSLLLTNMKLEQLEEVETKIGDRNAKFKKVLQRAFSESSKVPWWGF